MNSLEILDKKNQLQEELRALIDGAKQETREMNEDEKDKFEKINEEIKACNDKLAELEEEKKKAEDEAKKQEEERKQKELINKQMEKRTLSHEIASALRENRKATINLFENRAIDSTTGADTIATDIFELLPALREQSVLGQVGAQFVSGIKDNAQFTLYAGAGAGWVKEGEEVALQSGTFSKKILKPLAISSRIIVSNQLLLQDNVGVEELLKADLIAAISDTLEATVFGDGAAVEDTNPAGLLNGVEGGTIDFDKLVTMEQTLDEAHVGTSNRAYVISPAIKATLRKTSVSGGKSDVRMVMDGACDNINGIKAITTSNAKGAILADWSNLVVGMWQNATLLVNPYTYASKNQTEIVATMYVNFVTKRDNAFVKAVKA